MCNKCYHILQSNVEPALTKFNFNLTKLNFYNRNIFAEKIAENNPL